MVESLFEIVIGAILFVGSIVAIMVLRPGADGKAKPLATAPVFSIVIPVSIVSSLATGGAMLTAAIFPIFFK